MLDNRIAYVTTTYNWDCFSMMRCGYETLQNMGIKVDIFFEKCPEIFDYDQIWLMSTGLYLTDVEYQNYNGKVITFGLSEPCELFPEKRRNCDIYCTNDLKISRETGAYWFPTSADIRYHKNLHLKKEIDVVFIGVGIHPTISNRIQVVERLRNEGINIEVYGCGWPDNVHNFPSIDGPILIEKMNQARIILDIATETSSLARRIFEGASCGSGILARNREDIKLLFEENKEIMLYNCEDEIPEKIKWLLNHPEFLQQMSKNCENRCIMEHDIKYRINNLLKYIEESNI